VSTRVGRRSPSRYQSQILASLAFAEEHEVSKPLIANRETKNEESAWSARIKKRDKGLCQFERADKGWKPCHRSGTDSAHLYRRFQCGRAKFDDAVAVAACRDCHVSFDRYEYEVVRAPIDRLRSAWDAINAVSRVMVMGPRP